MGGMFSKRSWYVWFRDKRYRFNYMQATDEYGQVPNCFGWRKQDGQRTMNWIYLEKLDDQKRELKAEKQDNQAIYVALRKELKEMLATESRILTKINRKDAEKLRKDSHFLGFVRSYIEKTKEVTAQQKRLQVIDAQIAQNQKDTVRWKEHEKEFAKGTTPLNFAAHAAAMGSSLQGLHAGVNHEANEEARDMVDAQLEENNSFLSDGMTSDKATNDDIERVFKLLFNPQVQAEEFQDLATPTKISSLSKGKSKSQLAAISVADEDSDTLFMSEKSRSVYNNTRGRGGAGAGFSDDDL